MPFKPFPRKDDDRNKGKADAKSDRKDDKAKSSDKRESSRMAAKRGKC